MNTFFSSPKSNNIFVSLLKILHIKHTETFSNRYFNEHPHRNNLYGLSKMLTDYCIENQGVRIGDKEKTLPLLEPPFIAYTGNSFVTVYENTKDEVKYIWHDKKINITPKEFLPLWSGVTLIVEANDNSIEPDYKEHRKQEITSSIKNGLLAVASVLSMVILAGSARLFYHSGFLFSLLINITGLYVGYLLILKQMHIHSHYSNKICSLFGGHNDCNSILESNAAKIMGFSWSEIGMGYFISNLLIILVFPELYPFLAIINIFALPYSFWSIWYQNRAKQWCGLCLLSQVILWLLFLCNIAIGAFEIPLFSFQSVLLVACLYAMPVLVINKLVPYLSKAVKTEQVTQEINAIKANEVIFKTLLTEKPGFETGRSDSIIVLGNPEAKNMITVVTNPHCSPCAIMHPKLEELLEKTANGFCIQYILTSFSEELEESSKLFIAMYQQLNMNEFLDFLREWYKHGKNNRNEFYQKYPILVDDKKIAEELDKHKLWLEKTKIRHTPAILFNGYELSRQYQVSDLKYFTNFIM